MGDFRYRYRLGEFESEIEMNLEPSERKKVAQSLVKAVTSELEESSAEEELLVRKENFLIKVRKTKDNKWVIDEDSYEIFEDIGGNYPHQEITASQIRALPQSNA